MQQISEGRFRFGMSSGDSALRNIGVQPGSVELMERYMRAIQTMTAGASAAPIADLPTVAPTSTQDPAAVPTPSAVPACGDTPEFDCR